MMEGKRLEIIDENENRVHIQVLTEDVWNQLLRLLELLSDEETKETLADVIKKLEDPKREITGRIVTKVKQEQLLTHLQDALMALPMKTLKEVDQAIGEIKLEREPGGDCLHLIADDKRYTLHL